MWLVRKSEEDWLISVCLYLIFAFKNSAHSEKPCLRFELFSSDAEMGRMWDFAAELKPSEAHSPSIHYEDEKQGLPLLQSKLNMTWWGGDVWLVGHALLRRPFGNLCDSKDDGLAASCVHGWRYKYWTGGFHSVANGSGEDDDGFGGQEQDCSSSLLRLIPSLNLSLTANGC